MTIYSWAPGHTTLFFAVPEQFDQPEKMGSIGGGINFEKGVTTKLEKDMSNSVLWNSQNINGIVTRTVISLFGKLTGKEIKVKVSHESELGIGFGFSTSGAGAIGTVLGLNELFNTQFDNTDLFELAHKAEIINHTGLGSVVGQITGGIEFRLSQGGPKLCETKSVSSNANLVIAMLGPLSTADVLTSENHMKLVTSSGMETIKNIQNFQNITIKSALQMGRQFMEKCGLMTEKVKQMIKELDNIGERFSSMAMIGEALIIFPQNRNQIKKWLNLNKIHFLETNISSILPHVIK
ncbi:MAG: Pantoate kinase [Candidatus Heimdallarchaeota archaeon LC_2]|nr:MAG: Pantoate kinase [Candidatus Heimdallarchaeota archaeon LC_2]